MAAKLELFGTVAIVDACYHDEVVDIFHFHELISLMK